jgi:hypothetical protein
MMLSELRLPAAVGKQQSQPCHTMSQSSLTKRWLNGERLGRTAWLTLEKRMAHLEKLDPAKLKLRELEELTRITEITDKTARRTFGLDTPQAHNSLHVHVGRDASTAPKQLEHTTEIIDVSAETCDEGK